MPTDAQRRHSIKLGIPNSFQQDAPITKIDNDWYAGVFRPPSRPAMREFRGQAT